MKKAGKVRRTYYFIKELADRLDRVAKEKGLIKTIVVERGTKKELDRIEGQYENRADKIIQ